MPKWLIWTARATLIGLSLIAVMGAIDVNDRFAAVQIRPDRVNHAILSFGLTFLLLASFRTAPARAVALLMLSLGLALEGLQLLGMFAGDAEWGDIGADLAGVLLAAVPVGIGRSQGRRSERLAAEEEEISKPGAEHAAPAAQSASRQAAVR